MSFLGAFHGFRDGGGLNYGLVYAFDQHPVADRNTIQFDLHADIITPSLNT